MTIIELELEAAIKTAKKYDDVRFTLEEAKAILELLKERQEKINELEEHLEDIYRFGY